VSAPAFTRTGRRLDVIDVAGIWRATDRPTSKRFASLREAARHRYMARYAMPRELRPVFASLARDAVRMASCHLKPALPG
jgi:hypothetical protein